MFTFLFSLEDRRRPVRREPLLPRLKLAYNRVSTVVVERMAPVDSTAPVTIFLAAANALQVSQFWLDFSCKFFIWFPVCRLPWLRLQRCQRGELRRSAAGLNLASRAQQWRLHRTWRRCLATASASSVHVLLLRLHLFGIVPPL